MGIFIKVFTEFFPCVDSSSKVRSLVTRLFQRTCQAMLDGTHLGRDSSVSWCRRCFGGGG